MKVISYISRVIMFLIILLTLVSYKASKSNLLEGSWSAQDASGSNLIITFTSDTVTVDGEKFGYSQENQDSTNGIEYIQITQNGEKYTIVFPDEDNNLAFLIQPNSEEDLFKGKILYALDKDENPDYKAYVNEYFE